MEGILRLLGFVVSPLRAFADSSGGEAPAGTPVTIEYYYKLVAGGTSEWLALYKQNHNPILKELMKEGLLKSERLYERRFHAETPAWDYKIVMVWRDWAALEQAHYREPQIIRALYPDKAAHDQAEKRRWELTVAHWDDVLREVSLE